jgi:hypothetical protein
MFFFVAIASFWYGAQPDGVYERSNGDGYLWLPTTKYWIGFKSVFRQTLKPVKGEYIVDAVGGLRLITLQL